MLEATRSADRLEAGVRVGFCRHTSFGLRKHASGFDSDVPAGVAVVLNVLRLRKVAGNRMARLAPERCSGPRMQRARRANGCG